MTVKYHRKKRSPSELGKRLKLVRESAGIDSAELAAVAGLSRTHVHSIEVGWILNPGYGTVQALSEVLGAPLDYLVNGKGRAPSAKVVKCSFSKARKSRR